MTPKEFDNIIETCGINVIRSSHESVYVRCVLCELDIREGMSVLEALNTLILYLNVYKLAAL